MSKKIPVANHLSDNEYKLFLQVYAEHNRSIGLKERANYNLSEVVRVERNIKDKCLNVFFRNGEWFKYYVNGTWG